MKKILILHIAAGHGHTKAAEAIAEAFQAKNDSNVQVEIFDALEKTNPLFRRSYSQIYFKMVRWAAWFWGFFYFLTNVRFVYFFLAPLRFFWNRLQAKSLLDYLRKESFDVILFTHFLPAELCASAKGQGLLQSKLITVVTDVIPHAVWINPGTDFYWVMAEESIKTLVDRGVARERIHIGGIPISERFIKTSESQVASFRNQFGLKPDRTTLLFTSGSFGIGPTEAILHSLQEIGDRIQVLVVCGRNKTLYEVLNKKRYTFPITLFGFVDNMHEIMSVTDLMIAKPGGITMCESLAKGIPIIIMSPIPGQETYNAEWLLRRRAAFQIKTFSEIKEIVLKLSQDSSFRETIRNSIAKIAKPYAARDIVDFALKETAKTA